MAKFVTVVSSEYKLPLYISYTCAKCGKEVNLQEDVYVNGSISGFKEEDAKKLLASQLPLDTVKQLEHMADYGKKHIILMPYDPLTTSHRVHKAILFRCPACKTMQVPSAGGRQHTPVGNGGGMRLSTVLAILLIIGWFVGMSVVLFQRQVEPMNLLYVTLAAIAGGVALGVWNQLVKKKAYRDPEYMLKHFGSVLNPAVSADFSPYGLEKILMNSQK